MKFLKDCYSFYELKLIQLLTFQRENETNFYETVLEMQGFFLFISGLHRLVIRNILVGEFSCHKDLANCYFEDSEAEN